MEVEMSGGEAHAVEEELGLSQEEREVKGMERFTV